MKVWLRGRTHHIRRLAAIPTSTILPPCSLSITILKAKIIVSWSLGSPKQYISICIQKLVIWNRLWTCVFNGIVWTDLACHKIVAILSGMIPPLYRWERLLLLLTCSATSCHRIAVHSLSRSVGRWILRRYNCAHCTRLSIIVIQLSFVVLWANSFW